MGLAGVEGKDKVEVVDFAQEYGKVVRYESNKYNKGSRRYKGRGNKDREQGHGHPQQQQQDNNNNNNKGREVIELRDVRREVADLGARGFGKKEAKEWKQQVYSTLGAKAEKSPRINARIGLGIAKKKIERERKAKELAREMGMLTPKKGGKKGKVKRRK
ncbi:hypothetical protein HOP50_04g27630 [Chloropicon primus]|uniref:Uncharacterized protein n=1 Tax=Chloropicon primus TaxID=1764295 RepID=A0A5B8MID2_9CHLO|nr:hypothetical protein A3770_04p27640 [Chloropicon primus]UPQ99455.1 hypothetical protein HOP50_04g27630 [Chloropicon primus]|eukprot:QDZ20246.1 hypothetical protein A3770_04p27640 [Chloropicon primus]